MHYDDDFDDFDEDSIFGMTVIDASRERTPMIVPCAVIIGSTLLEAIEPLWVNGTTYKHARNRAAMINARDSVLSGRVLYKNAELGR